MADGTEIAGMEMEEREAPKMLRFKIGTELEGVLIGRESITIADKRVMRYTVKQRSDGAYVNFLGTADLVSKLRADDLGHYVAIQCFGEDQMVKKGDNCLKLFKVAVSKKAVQNLDITDADIPF